MPPVPPLRPWWRGRGRLESLGSGGHWERKIRQERGTLPPPLLSL